MEKNTVTTASHLLLIGGSAGSLDVIIRLLPALELHTHYAIIIVVHRRATPDPLLRDILASKTNWQVKEADEKEKLLPGYIYLVPPDYHLLLEKDHSVSLDDSEKINFSRPSIDVTFESAAEVYREKTVALLLSGANADGMEGMKRIKKLGGVCIVQTPESAEVSYMPEQAIRNVKIDHVVSAEEMGVFINHLIQTK